MTLEELYAEFERLGAIGQPGWKDASAQGVFHYTIRRGSEINSLVIPHPRVMTPEARKAIVEHILARFGPVA